MHLTIASLVTTVVLFAVGLEYDWTATDASQPGSAKAHARAPSNVSTASKAGPPFAFAAQPISQARRGLM